ncbi:cysteine/histidine-rich C1 domain family protein [Actinidia rufa]|uniref:Cysteine/histidine-rich C1 domain family protein n=1 Tax=Actinidia rufa TaxID=165716 RepID=A0A7J0FC30_9ERIC|nr:cysteine/histidine-rich C1 domain family protein [Actinidia rufa]
MELEHFSHQHPLLLHEEKPKENGGDEEIICHGCDKPIAGTNYCCEECNYFMHASCSQLSRQITQHPFHPKHPLTLFINDDEGRKWLRSRCCACNQPLGNRLAYNCAQCDFNLCLECVSLPLTIENRAHEHPLTLFVKRAKFCCDACGTEGQGMSYLCVTCQFWVHLECATLSNVINLSAHTHPLTLITSSLQRDDCRICDRELKADQWIYSCADCSFGVHVGCTTSKGYNTAIPRQGETNRQTERKITTQENQGNRDYKKTQTESTNSLQQSQKTIALGMADKEMIRAPDESMPMLDESIYLTTDDVEERTELRHFSHQHCLTLVCDDELKTGEQCNGCTQPISGPFYRCSQSCDFLLHKSCTQLRSEIRHPLHSEHRLKLYAKQPITSHGVFRCSFCSNYCNGFIYWCEHDGCKFGLDIKCSSIFGGLKHDAHDAHALTPLFRESYRTKCRACGLSLKKWTMACESCNFYLHVGCATLPLTVWYKFHRHQFKLTYEFVEDDSDEYYCDICEEEMKPEPWFYNCAKCDYPSHVSCMVGRHPRIKLGLILNVEDHPHNLRVIDEKQSRTNYVFIHLHCGQCKENRKSFLSHMPDDHGIE